MKIDSIDHFVLTVKSVAATCDFYGRALGMEVVKFGEGRTPLKFGAHKINLHPVENSFGPKADKPTPGSADVCFITSVPIADVVAHLGRVGVQIVEGPCLRSGARGPITSVYVRDPDQNLVEVSNYNDR